jgi:acetyltransferase-like isoleucine patch superfamily enzyme
MLKNININSQLNESLDAPWKLTNSLLRILYLPLNYFAFRINGIKLGRNSRIFGLPLIQKHRRATIEIGTNFTVRSGQRYNPVIQTNRCTISAREEGAKISIGNNVGVSSAIIVSTELVTIGDRATIGGNAVIIDTDFHPIAAEDRVTNPRDGLSKPIHIGNDVFIGMNSIILKGTQIGDGSVIGAGSVVSGTIPPRSIAAGNPARVVRQIDSIPPSPSAQVT